MKATVKQTAFWAMIVSLALVVLLPILNRLSDAERLFYTFCDYSISGDYSIAETISNIFGFHRILVLIVAAMAAVLFFEALLREEGRKSKAFIPTIIMLSLCAITLTDYSISMFVPDFYHRSFFNQECFSIIFWLFTLPAMVALLWMGVKMLPRDRFIGIATIVVAGVVILTNLSAWVFGWLVTLQPFLFVGCNYFDGVWFLVIPTQLAWAAFYYAYWRNYSSPEESQIAIAE